MPSSWFATLSANPPHLLTDDFDVHFPNPTKEEDIETGIEAFPFIVQLTLLENELSTLAHGKRAFDVDFVLEYEGRLASWMVGFREEQERVRRPTLDAYSSIRYHWCVVDLLWP
jgi:hypothetical protein